MSVRIGISGWRYAGWRGRFYSNGLRQADELAYAAQRFSTIEINGTFYSLQRPELFAAWADAVPEDFVFALKGSRFITHMLKLNRVATPLANFFAQGVLRLGRKLGPILWQLPPTFRFQPEKLAAFFDLLPRDTEAAAALARRHDGRLKARAFLKAAAPRKIRHALEVRHESFAVPEFVGLLKAHDIALVVSDMPDLPALFDVTSDFVYCRLHGSTVLYTSGYRADELSVWAKRLQSWAAGGEVKEATRLSASHPRRRSRDVFVYFDNDAKVRAPFDALSLIERLERSTSPPARRPTPRGHIRAPDGPSRTGPSAPR